MNDSVASRKRQRTDCDASEITRPVVLLRSRLLYFRDGCIIIKTTIPRDASEDIYQGSDTMSSVPVDGKDVTLSLLYRVHTGVLASHCKFFSTLFDGSQAAFGEVSAEYDGVPVMELPGDHWHAVDDFLKAMYIPKWVLPRPLLRAHGSYRMLQLPISLWDSTVRARRK